MFKITPAGVLWGALVGSIAALALLYFTPLRWVSIVEPVINDVDPKTFNELYASHPDDYLFIDVRSQEVYNTLHAKGAENMPIGSLFDGHVLLPKTGKKIALICSSGRLAGVAYGYLEHEGFLNLIRIKGGLQAWVNDELPVDGDDVHAAIPEVD